jgi:hypothetical protein
MRRLSLAAAMLTLVAACHSATEPAPSDVFVLTSIDSRPLPTTRSIDGATVLHETLILNGLGVATRHTTVQGSTPNTGVTTSVSYAYTREGDVVTLGDYICIGNVPCALHRPEQGLIDAAGLTLFPKPSLSSVSGPVLVYQRATFID